MSGSIRGAFAFVAVVFALGVPQAQAKILLRIAFVNHVKGDLFEFDRSGETDFLLAGTEVEVYDNKDGALTKTAAKSNGYGYSFGPALFHTRMSKNSIVFTATYSTFVLSLNVNTDGKSSCYAKVSTRLKPGQLRYVVEDPTFGRVELSQNYVKQVSCSLQTI